MTTVDFATLDLDDLISPVRDVEPIEKDSDFLAAVVKILDHGWVTGTMCDPSGKKCLVGAASEVLGVDYFRQGELAQIWSASFYEDNVSAIRDRISPFFDAVNDIQFEASERLYKILSGDLGPFNEEYFWADYTPDGPDDVQDFVTGWNDHFEDSDYSELRTILTDKIEELRSVGR